MKRVLTVDQSKVVRSMVMRHLESYGCEVIEAANGQQGIEAARQHNPDLILLDIVMPVMDGRQALAELRQDPALKAIPVNMLTAESRKDLVVEIVKLGVSGYIIKPFQKESFDKEVGKVLGGYRETRPGVVMDEIATQAVLREGVRSTLARLSRTGGLPALPATASTALALARDPQADIGALCRAIGADVGLTARLLRIANAPMYARRNPARTLTDAVRTLGLSKTCDVLVAACAREIYASPGPDGEALWQHAFVGGLAAEELARATRRVPAGIAFLPGLFHDVGRIAFLLADPSSFDVIRRLVEAGDGTSAHLEREWYGFDHAEAGAILAEEWGLGPEQCEAIRWHHAPARSPRARELAGILAAADVLAYQLGFDGGPAAPVGPGLAALGLGRDEEGALATRIGEAFAEQVDLLG